MVTPVAVAAPLLATLILKPISSLVLTVPSAGTVVFSIASGGACGDRCRKMTAYQASHEQVGMN